MELTKGQIMMINNMVNTELSNKNTVYDLIELVSLKEQLIKQTLHIHDVSNSTGLQYLFNKCKQDDPTMTKEEFNEALDIWLYRWEKDQQIKQMRSKLNN